MATSSLIGRRIFLAAASRTTQRTLQTSTFRAASSAIASTQSSNYQYQQYANNTNSNASLLAAAGATLAATSAIAANNNDTNKAKCCGIAGVVGAKGDARDYLIEGLTILKNRGYDSAGIATMDDVNPSLVRIFFSVVFIMYLCAHLVADLRIPTCADI